MVESPWQNLSEDDKKNYWASLALRHSHGIGQRTITKLLQHFGSAYAAIHNVQYWTELGIGADKKALISSGSWRTTAEEEWRAGQVCNAHIVLWHHHSYPPLLRELIDAPTFLYCVGDVRLLQGPCIAVVGSRQCSAEGVQVAASFARDIANAGITIVSGLAQGIDRVAHIASLEGIGKSIAVLGCGIDVIYPRQNKDIFMEMRKSGLIITEFAPGTQAHATHFPVRNRIISGLSLGVAVIEGSLRSGTLITARQALEQNREVYAIPGATTAATSKGCQELIRQGAKAVFAADDILIDLCLALKQYKRVQLPSKKTENTIFENALETVAPDKEKQQEHHPTATFPFEDFAPNDQEYIRNILKLLYAKGACHSDMISTHLHIPINELNALLVEMELCGFVKRMPGSQYIAISAIA